MTTLRASQRLGHQTGKRRDAEEPHVCATRREIELLIDRRYRLEVGSYEPAEYEGRPS